ncbi:ubiquitin-protein ligase SAN1 NDAI_0G02630 [Naumovozyma dairenensis CBS 421]|uniref:RING-type domain-containing protein n=1 Tax=Naumovozyma dairenensis (strain ATCC 10597 / BCRC 20456 / CBS 421 / NBRC 0211 / NRRL Y-12639) TaxID=1071378 RepID=G0WE29_NAUDC|nr:hypothetical protein NDAI_0G02630 [Naumovozyma dairenensis CBS 421]CCD26040.2 hypothetical protein NDAI_0G02630 [Naumovozyma dairenensis CBS 421]
MSEDNNPTPPPNRSINEPSSNDSTANTNSSNNAAAGGIGTRDITVSINYEFPGFNNNNNNNNTAATTTTPGTNGINNAGSEVPTTAPTERPMGAFILSFRDVPIATSQERLSTVISLATELAMRRYNQLIRPKGISRENFEKLPILKTKDITGTTECSICYEPYVDEPDPIDNKRKRAAGDGTEEDSNDDNKKKRKLATAGAANDTAPLASTSTTENTDTGNNSSSTNIEEAEEPVYLHSPVKLPCDHIFGRECLYKWSKLENSCPLCRHKIIESDSERASEISTADRAGNDAMFEQIRNMLYAPENNSNNTTSPAVNTATSTTIETAATAQTRNNTDNAVSNSSEGGNNTTQTQAPAGSDNLRRGTGPIAQYPLNTTAFIFLRVPPGTITNTGANTAANTAAPEANAAASPSIPATVPSTSTGTATNSSPGTTAPPVAQSNETGSRGTYNQLTDFFTNFFAQFPVIRRTENTNATTVNENPSGTAATTTTTAPTAPTQPPLPADFPQPNENVSEHVQRIMDMLRNRREQTMSNSLPIASNNTATNTNTNTNTNVNGSSSNPPTTGSNVLFHSGVASYRRPDGQVTTYPINNNASSDDWGLPHPPPNTTNSQSSANQPSSTTSTSASASNNIEERSNEDENTSNGNNNNSNNNNESNGNNN